MMSTLMLGRSIYNRFKINSRSQLTWRIFSVLNLQANEEEKSTVETKIQTAIAAYNDPNCFINF